MNREFPPDTFTEADVLRCLSFAGLEHKNLRRYILTQCPTHDDANPSAQIYKDDWFVNCHATCGRYHITKAFPELRENNKTPVTQAVERKTKMADYKTYDLMEEWKKMPLIPRDHTFKNLPLEVLDELGWRWDEAKNSYFIPYFSASKGSIPFAQWRHLGGDRRFTFLKDAKPTCYGTWNLGNHKLFVVEGASDAAVMEHCLVPWIALPSAASGELTKRMAAHCAENGITIVFAGDNDLAGLKIREALDEGGFGYRVKQPPTKYKDWADFYVAEGFQAVQDYCFEELFRRDMVVYDEVSEFTEEDAKKVDSALENVRKVFPGAEELTIINDPPKKQFVRSNQGGSDILY